MDEKIEEMAKILLKASCMGVECENCAFVKSVKEAQETCVCLKAFYQAGYRKESDTAREILEEVSKHYGGAWLVELYKKYSVDLGE